TCEMPRMTNSAWSAIARNWGLDTIFRARSALPVDIVSSRDIGYGTLSYRPDLVPGVPIWVDDPSVGGGRRINGALQPGTTNQFGAFLIPFDRRQGTLGRNVIRGFGMYQVDLGIRRQFPLTGKLKLQAKVELFNATNHPNFGDPATPGAFAALGS